jgi:hypothetical protein
LAHPVYLCLCDAELVPPRARRIERQFDGERARGMPEGGAADDLRLEPNAQVGAMRVADKIPSRLRDGLRRLVVVWSEHGHEAQNHPVRLLGRQLRSDDCRQLSHRAFNRRLELRIASRAKVDWQALPPCKDCHQVQKDAKDLVHPPRRPFGARHKEECRA